MSNQLSIINLILNAGLVVQAIMFILVIMSVYSWTIILARKKAILTTNSHFNKFFKIFDNNLKLVIINNSVKLNKENSACKVFNAGYHEFSDDNPGNIERAYRAMNLTMNSRIEELEQQLSVLAMIASSSPYIGLFGTVWGIMHSFIGLASVKQATITIVAPGIAEALIATAFGLFAAIPATIFYNRLSSQIEKISNKYQNVVERSLILMQKN